MIDKPQGWTSHDVVAKVRSLTRQPRIGHTGTLDPLATGLLVLCLGRATRLVEYLSGHDKRYEGMVELGATTDTDDAEGTVTSRSPVPTLADSDLIRLAEQFTGPQEQIPPAYSAIKKDGRRAYAAARAGAPLELTGRPVVVYSIEITPDGVGSLRLRVHCGPGTYVRSLARDLGAAIGCGGHLSALRRVAAGGFTLNQAYTLDAVAAAAAERQVPALLLPLDDGLSEMPAAIMGEDSALALRQGKVIALPGGAPVLPSIRIYDAPGAFLGVGSIDDQSLLRPTKVLG